MIQVSDAPLAGENDWPPDSIEFDIFERLKDDSAMHAYRSSNALTFDINIRKHITLSAKALNESRATFELFTATRANKEYWEITNAGGIRLRYGVEPSRGIQDIFDNSDLYGFECATAMVIIFYHAALQVIGSRIFNELFPNIYLYSWHFDSDFGLESVRTHYFIPGDVVYFNNPDFNVQSPQWRGENAVVLDNDTYFGHGIGIQTEAEMIDILNELRNPDSTQSAYLTNVVTRTDNEHLFNQTLSFRSPWIQKQPSIVVQHNKNSISHQQYLRYLKNL
ncbi:protein-glutamine gamma-glutamyltransferase [Salibacterium salarium]|uniref:Protein-glutamine gamma-glutamyltransferase n=1 Tax=Salibacterium salarium TaxID=284579 RepID=A0A3R9Q4W3_9BACI|nr:protein-glutamine gamma-glutamyltransferase [Salibacterium salarium]RSL33688.1 protein-glutamine gamma-glutamyltransferase [Salibacterium salarium]